MYSEKPIYADVEVLKWARGNRDGLVSEWISFDAHGLSLEEVRLERNKRLKRFPGCKVTMDMFQSRLDPEHGLSGVEYVILIHRPMFAEERKRLESEK